jgi:uncharacterized membrane protein
MGWSVREAMHLASAIGAGPGDPRRTAFALAIGAGAWLAQALVLLIHGRLPERSMLRGLGYGIAALSWLGLDFLALGPDPWTTVELPIAHVPGALPLACIAAYLALAHWLASRRAQLTDAEDKVPEMFSVAGNLVLMAWTAREGAHLAAFIGGSGDLSERVLGAVFASLGWTVQAVALLVLGWWRASSFQRWLGIGLLAVTSSKFLLYDLRTVDIFWRFLLAIVVGIVLMGVAYAYQWRIKRGGEAARSPGGSAEEPARE